MNPAEPCSAAAFMNSPSICRRVSAVLLCDADVDGRTPGITTITISNVIIRTRRNVFMHPPLGSQRYSTRKKPPTQRTQGNAGQPTRPRVRISLCPLCPLCPLCLGFDFGGWPNLSAQQPRGGPVLVALFATEPALSLSKGRGI